MQLSLTINLAPETAASIAEQLAEFRDAYQVMQWFDEEEYHIELFHFGKVDESKIPALSEMIERGIYDVKPFTLFSEKIHMMVKSSLTFYLGFYKSQPIEYLVKQLKSSFQIVDNLVFFPHLPFARYRIPSKQQYLVIKKKCEGYVVDVEIPVTQITLVNSVIEHNKIRYEVVKEFALND